MCTLGYHFCSHVKYVFTLLFLRLHLWVTVNKILYLFIDKSSLLSTNHVITVCSGNNVRFVYVLYLNIT